MTFTIDLPEEQLSLLAARARARGISEEQYARLVLGNDLSASPTSQRRHISDVLRENILSIPIEARSDIPADGASQHDHYIYGLPKK